MANPKEGSSSRGVGNESDEEQEESMRVGSKDMKRALGQEVTEAPNTDLNPSSHTLQGIHLERRSPSSETFSDVEFPEELVFLTTDVCCPNLKDPEVRKAGGMRPSQDIQGDDVVKVPKTCGKCRELLAVIVYSFFVQSVVFIVIMFDVTCTIIELSRDDKELWLLQLGDILTIVVLTADVLTRFFVEGMDFLHSKMNIFELILVPITIGEVVLLRNSSLPLPLLRALRPILRVVRVCRILVRTAGKGRDYLIHLKHTVSGDRIRFQQDGFDLDLAYIGAQIIAMPVPGIGAESIFFNSHMEVARFLNEKHGNKYLLLNVTEEQRYPLTPFFNRYWHFPISQDSVPSLGRLIRLCEILDEFLRVDPENTLAVHSRHGQGRVSLVVIALMLFQGTFTTVESAVQYFEHNRAGTAAESHPDSHRGSQPALQTLDCASQRRFLDYFAHVCQVRREDPEKQVRPAKLKRIQIIGLPNVHQCEVKCYCHPHSVRPNGLRASRTDRSVTSETSSFDLSDMNDDALDKALEVPEETMMEQLKKICDEGAFDTPYAGTAPMSSSYEPEFTSIGVDDRCVSKTVDPPSDPTQPSPPGIWEISNVDLDGEFRIEVHRQMPERAEKPTKKSGDKDIGKRRSRSSAVLAVEETVASFKTYVDIAVVILNLLPCCCCMRRATRKNPAKFEGGMLFGLWMHTGFLELDEPPQDARQRVQGSVRVVLDRFQLDKASLAPPLRNCSTSFRFMLEFDVEHRIEWKELNDMHGEHHLVLATGPDMSECESLHWLTFLSEKIWPSFEKGFSKLVSDLLAPLGESLPPPFKHIQLAQFSLGPEYPKFGPINACSRDHEGLEVQLDIMLHYETYTNIVVDLGLASLGISYLKVAGVVSVKFKPIINELPVFTAVQLLFLNSPKIEIKFAKGLEIANLSMVRELVHNGMDKALRDLMVLPNMIKINWADPSEDTAVTFQSILPANTMRLGVVEGRNLKAESSLMHRPPDAFVRINVGGSQEITTRTIGKSSNPVWAEDFDCLVYDLRQYVGGTVYDIDFAGRHKNIGTLKLTPIAMIISAGEEGLWIELTHTPQGSASQILVRAILFELRSDRGMFRTMLGPEGDSPRYRTSTSSVSHFASTNSLVVGAPTEAGETIVNLDPPASNERKAADVSPLAGVLAQAATAFANVRDGIAASSDNLRCSDEPQVDEEAVGGAGCTPELSTRPSDHAGAVALLICAVSGGHLPTTITEKRTEVELRVHTDMGVKRGKQKIGQKFQEVVPADPGTINEKMTRSIERLADQGLKAEDIAKALEEDEAEVHRIIRRRGWNISMQPKICVFLHEADLFGAKGIDISMHLKKKTIAKVVVPLMNVVNHFSLKHNEIIKLKPTKGSGSVELDAEIRICTLYHESLNLEGAHHHRHSTRHSHRVKRSSSNVSRLTSSPPKDDDEELGHCTI